MTEPLARRLLAEGLGTAFLLIAVVGSGIMAARLANGNAALALLANALATGAMLAVLILMLAPVSGAHFNPVVSIVASVRGQLPPQDCLAYLATQSLCAIIGVWAAHAMFDLPLLQLSSTARSGPPLWFAEGVATFGLLLTILGCAARAPTAIPFAVGLYIVAAYWFTASTSFANPAVTVARSLTDTFSGIAPAGVAGFVGAQLVGGLLAIPVARLLWPRLSLKTRAAEEDGPSSVW